MACLVVHQAPRAAATQPPARPSTEDADATAGQRADHRCAGTIDAGSTRRVSRLRQGLRGTTARLGAAGLDQPLPSRSITLTGASSVVRTIASPSEYGCALGVAVPQSPPRGCGRTQPARLCSHSPSEGARAAVVGAAIQAARLEAERDDDLPVAIDEPGATIALDRRTARKTARHPRTAAALPPCLRGRRSRNAPPPSRARAPP